MTWIHPFLLAGLAAIGIPFLLHFLGRRPAAIVPLPTIELLRRAVEVRRRRSRLRELLLLLVRAGFVAAITMAVARPLFISGSASGESSLAEDHIFVIDNSLSMSTRLGDDLLLNQAKKEIRNILASMKKSDRAAIWSLVPEETPIGGLTDDHTFLARQLASVNVTYEAGSFGIRLRELLDTFSAENRPTHWWVFTDGTERPWRDGLPVPIPPENNVAIHVIDVSNGRQMENVSLLGASQSSHAPSEIVAQVRTVGITSTQTVTFSIWKNGQWEPIDRQFAHLLPDRDATVAFRVPRKNLDEVIGRITLETDALDADNSTYIITGGSKRLDVTVINGNPRRNPKDDAAYFVVSALNPPAGSLEEGEFRVTEWDGLQNELLDLSETDAVVVVDGADLADETVQSLSAHVHTGGGLLIDSGETFLQPTANRSIDRLLPVQVRTVRRTRDTKPLHLIEPGSSSPLAFLRTRWATLLGRARFEKIMMTDLASNENVWLWFENRLPALIGKKFGAGIVMFWGSSWGGTWNDMALAPGYPAFIRSLVMLSTRGETSTKRLVLRKPIGAYLGIEETGVPDARPTRFEGLSAAGEGHRLDANGWWLPKEPGLWKISYRTREETKIGYVLTDPDASEFDLRRWDPEKIEKIFTPHPVHWEKKQGDSFAGVTGAVPFREELSTSLALLALLFLLGEAFLAGRPPRFIGKLFRGVILVGPFLLVESGDAWALGPPSGTAIAQVAYNGGNANPHTRPLEYLLQKSVTMTSIHAAPEPVTIALDDPRLYDYPFLYWAGDRGFPLPAASDLARLRRHLLSGGFLFFDDALGSDNTAFRKSVDRLVHALFPEKTFQRLDTKHSIYRSFFLLDRAWGRAGEIRDMHGLTIDRRTAIVFFAGDLGGALARDGGGKFTSDLEEGSRQRALTLRFGVNILMYTLTLDYKQDQIHIPFILERRG